MPSTDADADVYRNLTRGAWSVRVGGRVVGHVPAIALAGVALRASEASRLRCLRLGIRDVHAWARGVPVPGLLRPARAVRIRYRISEPGFRFPDGQVLAAAAVAWFEADGKAWCLAGRGDTVSAGGTDMAKPDSYKILDSDLAHLAKAGLLDDWAVKRAGRRGEGYVLVGTDEQGRVRETGLLQGWDLQAGWAWVSGTGLLRLGTARAAIPTTGVTL
jgi:hypothetical protein